MRGSPPEEDRCCCCVHVLPISSEALSLCAVLCSSTAGEKRKILKVREELGVSEHVRVHFFLALENKKAKYRCCAATSGAQFLIHVAVEAVDVSAKFSLCLRPLSWPRGDWEKGRFASKQRCWTNFLFVYSPVLEEGS